METAQVMRKFKVQAPTHSIDCPRACVRLPQVAFLHHIAYRISSVTGNLKCKSSNRGERPIIAEGADIPSPALAPPLVSPIPPLAATVTTIQCMCLNTVLGFSAVPLLCTASGSCSDGTSIPAPTAVAALVISSAAQAAGTCCLVALEERRCLTSLHSRARENRQGNAFADLLSLLGFTPTPGALACGITTAVAAAIAVAAVNLALAIMLSLDPTANGNTRAIQAVLQASADASGAAAAVDTSASTAWALPCILVSESLLAPLTEEVLFRGLLLGSLLGGTPVEIRSEPLKGWLAPVLGQAAMFACYHLSLSEWPAQFALGLVLGTGYVLSGRNLATSMLGHGLYNGTVVLLLGLW